MENVGVRAGYSDKTANEQGARLLANVSVKAALADRMKAGEKMTFRQISPFLGLAKHRIFARAMRAEKVPSAHPVRTQVRGAHFLPQ